LTRYVPETDPQSSAIDGLVIGGISIAEPTRMARTSLATSGATAAVSLSLPVAPDVFLTGTPSRMRTLLVAGVLAASGIITHAVRRGHGDALRRRVLRRLDRLAPRVRYSPELEESVVNATCPVCLSDFSASPDRPIRLQKECRHAVCAECLELWVVHTAKSHLNPARFGLTRGGDIVSWSQPPNCPLCRCKLGVISDADIREAVLAAMEQQGGALSSFYSYQHSPLLQNLSFG
jgi:hypothetical protein